MANPYAFEHTSTGTLQFPTGGMLPKTINPFHSLELNEIFAALAKAQAIIKNPEKNAKNTHFKSHYTTLDVGLTAVREALAAHGIAIFQRTYMNDKLLMVQTVLGHSSGQWLSSEYPVIMYPARPQEAMAALTYSRRASLFAAAGIAGEDDDGNSIAKIEFDPTPEPTEQMSIIVRNMMLKEMASCTNLKELATWSAKHGSNKSKLTADDKAFVTKEFETLQKHLKEANNG